MLKQRKSCEGEVYNRGTKASTGFRVPPPFEMNFSNLRQGSPMGEGQKLTSP